MKTSKGLLKKNKRRNVLPYKYDNYQDFLKSLDWKVMRFKVLKRDDNKCVYCQGPATQVHHLKYTTKAFHAEKLDNLVAVCNDCHKLKHTELYKKYMQCLKDSGLTNKEIKPSYS